LLFDSLLLLFSDVLRDSEIQISTHEFTRITLLQGWPALDVGRTSPGVSASDDAMLVAWEQNLPIVCCKKKSSQLTGH
jgi:hypothetical protein